MNKKPLQDISQFNEYCALYGVKEIKQDTVIIQNPTTAPKRAKPKTHSVAIDSDHGLFTDVAYHDTYAKNGQDQVVRDMHNGKYKIVATLDLHNRTQAEALAELSQFINSHTTIGDACLKIIHGKGLNSENNTPVLKVLVKRFLEHQSQVNAYTSGKANQGGSGVTLVKLKSPHNKKH